MTQIIDLKKNFKSKLRIYYNKVELNKKNIQVKVNKWNLAINITTENRF